MTLVEETTLIAVVILVGSCFLTERFALSVFLPLSSDHAVINT